MAMPTTAAVTYNNTRLEPYIDPEDAREITVNLPASVTYLKGTILGELSGTTATHTLTASGALSAGSFTLSDGVNTTAAIAYNATAAQLTAALLAATPAPLGYIATGGTFTTPTAFTLTSTIAGPRPTVLTVGGAGVTGGTITDASTVTGTAGPAGTYKAYTAAATDGSQIPKVILAYAASTDASGNITWGGQDFGETRKSVPAYISGTFRTEEIVGLDANAMTVMGARLLNGTIGTGTARWG
jgi:hypothetical protein